MDWSVNLWSVLVAALAAFFLGFMWYGPLFGSTWMKLSGIKMPKGKELEKAKKGMWKSMFAQFAGMLVASYALAVLINNIATFSYLEGALIGLIVGIGVLATNTLQTVLWEGRSVKLYLFNNAYNVVLYIIMGAIIACPIWT